MAGLGRVGHEVGASDRLLPVAIQRRLQARALRGGEGHGDEGRGGRHRGDAGGRARERGPEDREGRRDAKTKSTRGLARHPRPCRAARRSTRTRPAPRSRRHRQPADVGVAARTEARDQGRGEEQRAAGVAERAEADGAGGEPVPQVSPAPA